MVVVDNSFFTLLMHPGAHAPIDPSTKAPIDRLEDRIAYVVSELTEQGEKVIVPTPVLSEILILAGTAGQSYLDEIHDSPLFKVEPFDERAAVELAALEVKDKAGGSKRGTSGSPWAKVRFDRQVVAIAKVNNASRIYSDDEDLGKFAARCGIEVVRSWELPLPPAQQIVMSYDQKESESGQEDATTIAGTDKVPGSRGGPTEDKAGTEGAKTEPKKEGD